MTNNPTENKLLPNDIKYMMGYKSYNFNSTYLLMMIVGTEYKVNIPG